MALYGGLISAPLGHVLITILQWLFAGRTSVRAKVMQIVVSNLVVSNGTIAMFYVWLVLSNAQISPIQNSIYLVAMAVIAGARTTHQVSATVRAGFLPVMKVSWITSPIALAFAQQFLPQETWVPFFNAVAFVIGTYINTITKKKRLRALRQKREAEGRDASGRPPPGF